MTIHPNPDQMSGPLTSAVASIWSRLVTLAGEIGHAGGCLIDRVISAFLGDAEHRRAVAFTIAVVALAAKMARADGVVTEDEVAAFRAHFHVVPEEQANVERLFRMAQGDVAGYDYYARRVAELLAEDPELRADVIDVLFMIAAADGHIHEAELAFLEDVAEILHIEDAVFCRIAARHTRAGLTEPLLVLGLSPEASDEEVKTRYRALVKEHHPDRLMARGLPPEFLKLATDRLAAINAAFDQVMAARAPA